MIVIWCRDWHHADGTLCHECEDLLSYATERLLRCPFQESKTTCAKCPVHCYKKSMKEKIRAVMRHSGPKMIRLHPLMALRHAFDRLRKTPESEC
ncbi:MAG: nitrous oxide-stimulated promoter family protein [Syntrophales bacterium]|nr:nitrous oxide-stimulated promoter family protein [Syntrophales bacterium]